MLHSFFTQEAGTSIFKEVNPKVYVKRVNESNDGFLDLEPTDAISFKIVRGTQWTATSSNDRVISNTDWFKAGRTVEMVATAMLETSTLQTKISGISGLKVLPDGAIYKERTGGNWYAYKSANNIAFKHTDNGVLEITTIPGTLLSNYDSFNGADLNKLNEAFAGNNTDSVISIEVKI